MKFCHIAFWPTWDVSFAVTLLRERIASKNGSQVGPGRKIEIMWLELAKERAVKKILLTLIQGSFLNIL